MDFWTEWPGFFGGVFNREWTPMDADFLEGSLTADGARKVPMDLWDEAEGVEAGGE